ncbi:MAG: glycoside hydrolase family 99-like domain-containing protein [Chloroflexi bacterium]|nr:glycoside hydrolase family 99-like domain-containing protein [Chloroflexota bacterium]
MRKLPLYFFVILGLSISCISTTPESPAPLITATQPTPLPPTPLAVAATPFATFVPTRTPPPKGNGKLFIANYFPWYDISLWSQKQTWDIPLTPYSSDDAAIIQQHIKLAQAAGLDGFTVHWFQANDRTDKNFSQVLKHSAGADFHSTVMFLNHIVPHTQRQTVADSLRYILTTYGDSPNFLRVNNKPILFFSDMPRVPLGNAVNPIEAWRAIRKEVDPKNESIWIAEGLDPVYLNVFDGLLIYKIDHACCPESYKKAPRFAAWVRDSEKATGMKKFWIGTIQPGWDDTRTVGHDDLRIPSQPFARDRQGGAYYLDTFNAVTPTNPDMLLLHSFNEWVEGSQIEPGTSYGDLYLNLTRKFSDQFKGIK